jgi:hypothetical protein
MMGNTTGFEGVYDSAEKNERVAQMLVAQSFGDKDYTGDTAIPRIKGMKYKYLNSLSDFLKDLTNTQGVDPDTVLARKELAKQQIDLILQAKTKSATLYALKRLDAVQTYKYAPTVYGSGTQDNGTEQALEDKVKKAWKEAIDNLKLLKPSDILTYGVGSGAMMAALEGYGILRRELTGFSTLSFGCVLGVVPVPHVEEIEVARSGKVLKFRATGSVFLAKQQTDSSDAIRITGKLYRDEISWLVLFWYLYYYGRSENEEDISDMFSNPVPYNLEEMRKNARNLQQVNFKRGNPSSYTYRTFPFVSRHVIVPNCFIETVSFESKIEDGIDTVRYAILMRTYEKAEKFKVYKTDDPNIFYAMNNPRIDLAFSRILEFGINVIWRTIQQNFLVANTGSWKVSISKPGIEGNSLTKDTYYNIDVSDVVGTFAMGAMGIVGSGF